MRISARLRLFLMSVFNGLLRPQGLGLDSVVTKICKVPSTHARRNTASDATVQTMTHRRVLAGCRRLSTSQHITLEGGCQQAGKVVAGGLGEVRCRVSMCWSP